MKTKEQIAELFEAARLLLTHAEFRDANTEGADLAEVRLLTAFVRQSVRPDDADAPTGEWLEHVGFTETAGQADPSKPDYYECYERVGHQSINVFLNPHDKAEPVAIMLGSHQVDGFTRGHVRLLCRLFGVPLEEPTE